MKTVKAKLKVITVMDELFHHVISFTLNGKKGSLLVDSGASRTVFDKERFSLFKVNVKTAMCPTPTAGANGAVPNVDVAVLKKINFLGKLDIKNYLIALADLSQINRMLVSFKNEPIDGVAGSDLLKMYGATIDFGNDTIILKYDEKANTKKNDKLIKKLKQTLNV